jgi:signal transduction histidine kinase
VARSTDANENERAIVQLRRSLQRKDKFLALAVHEMRGPLAPISRALTLLRQRMDEPAGVNQSCATMARQVAQLMRLVDDLFDLARSQHAQILIRRAAIDLEAPIASAIEAAQPLIASRGQSFDGRDAPRRRGRGRRCGEIDAGIRQSPG